MSYQLFAKSSAKHPCQNTIVHPHHEGGLAAPELPPHSKRVNYVQTEKKKKKKIQLRDEIGGAI